MITNSFIDATLTDVYTSSGETAITSMIFCNYADADNIACLLYTSPSPRD